MRNLLPALTTAAVLLPAAAHAVTIVDPTFSTTASPIPNLVNIDLANAGSGWFAGYSGRYTIFDAGSPGPADGEASGPSGSFSAFNVIGQIIDDDNASTGAATFAFEYLGTGLTGGSLLWGIYGTDATTAALTDVELRDAAVDADWVPLATGSIDLASITLGSTLNLSSPINLGSGYEYIAIRIGTQSLTGTTRNIRIDNVSVTPVPEPATTVAALAAGALGIAIIRRRR